MGRNDMQIGIGFPTTIPVCLTCGHVGCCDDSKNKNATRHFHATNQQIIQSFEPGEYWAWCYIDELLLEPA